MNSIMWSGDTSGRTADGFEVQIFRGECRGQPRLRVVKPDGEKHYTSRDTIEACRQDAEKFISTIRSE
jgi:hypothetical protein